MGCWFESSHASYGINKKSYTIMMTSETRTYAERKAKNPEWAKKMAARVSATRRKNMATLKEEAGNCCSKCGYNKCLAALEFHHPDPTIKEGKVIGTGASLKKQREEASKCVLLCANCHREAHFLGRLAQR
jgi:hypothetical protein